MRKNNKLFLTAAVSAALLIGGYGISDAGTVLSGLSPETRKDFGLNTVGPNSAPGEYASVTGGAINVAKGKSSTIAGGYNNATYTNGYCGAILGGEQNEVNQYSGTVVGGGMNGVYGENSGNTGTITDAFSAVNSGGVVVGGYNNILNSFDAVIVGGSQNYNIEGSHSVTIGGVKDAGDTPVTEDVYKGSSVKEEDRIAFLPKDAETSSKRYNVTMGSGSTSIGGGSTGANAVLGLSIGYHSVVIDSSFAYEDTYSYLDDNNKMVSVKKEDIPNIKLNSILKLGSTNRTITGTGTALGFEATCDEPNTVAFGHDAGDVSGYIIEWQQRTDKDSSGNIITNADYTTNDYTKQPKSITEEKYTTSKYNRLVKIADGIDAHDAVTVEQLNKAVAGAGGGSGKTYTAGSDIDISSANAISVKKAGTIASGNTGLVTGGTVYSTTNALNTQIKTTSQEVAKISDKVSSYGKTITSISSSVTSAISNMKNNQANFVDTSLSNISTDGRDVIKQVVRDVLAANTASTASTTASAKANLLKTSFMVAPMRAPASLSAGDHVTISGNTISVDADGTVASGDTGLVTGGTVYDAIKDKADKSYVDEGLAKKADISYVDQGLSQKVNVSDFTPVKQQVDTNTTDISALKTGKADIDGSNINVGSFTAKLNTGKVEKGNTGLVSGGTVYESLQTKADVGYVNTMGLALDSEIKGTAQGLHNEIQDMGNRLTKDINRVGAGAAALAALHPQDFNPYDKWDFAVGYGHYKNANASAVGAFYRPNAGTTVSLAATVGNGDPQISAGVSFKIGMGKNVEKVMVNKDDYDKLNRKVESQAIENKEMKEAMNAQGKEISEQKAEILKLRKAIEALSTK